MTHRSDSTRRTFLKGGALLAAPLAVAPGAAMADDGQTRLARLEDERDIRDLHQAWLRRVNTGTGDVTADDTVRRITPDPDGEPDAIDVAADGAHARGRFRCMAEFETGIAEDCTLARMAREQGDGVVRRRERRILEIDFVKTGGAWAIAQARLAPVPNNG